MPVIAIRVGRTTRFDRFGPPAQHDQLRAPAHGRLPDAMGGGSRCVRRKIAGSIEAGLPDDRRAPRRPAAIRRGVATRALPAFECPPGACRRNAKERDAMPIRLGAGTFASEPEESIESGTGDARFHGAMPKQPRWLRPPPPREAMRNACAGCPTPPACRVRGFSRASRQAGGKSRDGTPRGRCVAYRPSCVARWPMSDTS